MNIFKFFCFHATLLCSVILLAEPVGRYPYIDWPLSPEQVRTFFSGSALNLSSDEINAFFSDVLVSANSLLISDYNEYDLHSYSGVLLPTECDGDSCEVTIFPNEPKETITLSDALNSELSETQSVMTYQNVSLVQGRGRDNEDGVIFEVLSYGGWQEHHIFSAQAAFVPSVNNFEHILVHGFSIGSQTGANPVSGSGTWRGVMIGTEVYGDDDTGLVNRFLQGDAELNLILDSTELEAEVSFINIRYLDTGENLDDMSWAQLHLEDGRFRGWNIDGYFYGPDHEEAGGIFEKDHIVGAFGLERVPGPSVFPRFPLISGSYWPFYVGVYLPGYEEEENNLDLTQAEIREIYDELSALTESSEFNEYLPFISASDLESVMAYGGISFAQGRYGDERVESSSLLGYGGWLEYNFFGVEVDNLNGDTPGIIPKTYSFGYETGSNPDAEGGSGTWEGVMIGYREDAPFAREVHPQIVGTATITISDFVDPSVDVLLSHEFTVTWEDIPLTDGSFQRTDDLGEIEGRFYGPNHEEVGGTFWYEDYRRRWRDDIDKVYGAFGAYRKD